MRKFALNDFGMFSLPEKYVLGVNDVGWERDRRADDWTAVVVGQLKKVRVSRIGSLRSLWRAVLLAVKRDEHLHLPGEGRWILYHYCWTRAHSLSGFLGYQGEEKC